MHNSLNSMRPNSDLTVQITAENFHLNAVRDNPANLSFHQKGNYLLKVQTENSIVKTKFIKN
jgi:hypothetical protein